MGRWDVGTVVAAVGDDDGSDAAAGGLQSYLERAID